MVPQTGFRHAAYRHLPLHLHVKSALSEPASHGIVPGGWYCTGELDSVHSSHMLSSILGCSVEECATALSAAELFQGVGRAIGNNTSRNLSDLTVFVASKDLKPSGRQARDQLWFALISKPQHNVPSQLAGRDGVPQPWSLSLLDDAGPTTRAGEATMAAGPRGLLAARTWQRPEPVVSKR